jgi:hypothetical protein
MSVKYGLVDNIELEFKINSRELIPISLVSRITRNPLTIAFVISPQTLLCHFIFTLELRSHPLLPCPSPGDPE